MNKYSMFTTMITDKNVYKAYKSCTRGRFKYKVGATFYRFNRAERLELLVCRLITQTYYVRPYSTFYVNDTKKRLVHAPCFEDKIVQHMLNNVLREIYEPLYIEDSYACIRGKGPQRAVLKLREYQLEANTFFNDPKLVKIDLSKFFYSINRDVLYKIIAKNIKDKKILWLIKTLLVFETPRGLPLGNLTSQQFANILLNQFDWYIKRTLRIRHYVRYADDMFILVDGKDNARKILNKCVKFLTEKLDLVCNPKKCYIGNIDNMIGLGYKLNLKLGLLPLARNKRKLIKILKSRDKLKRKLTRLNSWYGYNKIAKIHGFIERTMKRINPPDVKFNGGLFVAAG